nr:hypothetical protein TetV2_00020 [Oceanusvirus sp.]
MALRAAFPVFLLALSSIGRSAAGWKTTRYCMYSLYDNISCSSGYLDYVVERIETLIEVNDSRYAKTENCTDCPATGEASSIICFDLVVGPCTLCDITVPETTMTYQELTMKHLSKSYLLPADTCENVVIPAIEVIYDNKSDGKAFVIPSIVGVSCAVAAIVAIIVIVVSVKRRRRSVAVHATPSDETPKLGVSPSPV